MKLIIFPFESVEISAWPNCRNGGLLKGFHDVDDKLVNSLLGDVGEEGGSRRFI